MPPQGTLRIIRKPGERYCQDCVQEGDPKGGGEKKSDHKRQHVWASAGFEHKSDLRVYIDSILEPVVKPWILAARSGRINPFILEEDSDSGHRGGDSYNPVRRWKAEMGGTALGR